MLQYPTSKRGIVIKTFLEHSTNRVKYERKETCKEVDRKF